MKDYRMSVKGALAIKKPMKLFCLTLTLEIQVFSRLDKFTVTRELVK